MPLAGTPVTQEYLDEQRKAKEIADAKGNLYYGCGILIALVILAGLFLLGCR